MDVQKQVKELLEKAWIRFVRRDICNRVEVIGATLTESQINEVLYRYVKEDWVGNMNYEERIDQLINQEKHLVMI